MKGFITKYPFFPFLLSLFFVLHGFVENYDLVPVKPAILLALRYILFTITIFFFWKMIFKNTSRAGLMTFVMMSYFFFFGSIQDAINNNFPGSFVTKYSFILTASFIVFVFVFILLKKSKSELQKTTAYLNFLFLLLPVIDTGILVSKIVRKNSISIIPEEKLSHCASCPNPDIYFIIADGYPGKIQCRDILGYNNSPFEEELKKRGFHVTDSSLANYNFTFFSIGSMFNLNYLNTVSGSVSNTKNIPAGSKVLKNNLLINFLKKHRYTFYNYSIFDFKKNPAKSKPTFWINDTRLVTSQTFLSRLNRDLGYHLVTTFKIKPVNSFPVDQDLKNNNLLFTETVSIAKSPASSPKFVYTHLVMPHHPYYFDSTGKPVPLEKLTKEYAFDKKAAIDYLVYANKKYLELIDTILANSATPPVILLVSDHGFREIKEDKDKKTMFLNLNAVFFPDKDYAGFYKGMSNVNVFRILLNTQFRQKLPLLKDSVIFLQD